jgi:6-phosphogluconolactonase
LVDCKWEDGKLVRCHNENVLNPAVMKMHPNPAQSELYVQTECIHTEGYLTAYKVDPSTGGMRELGRVTLTGRSSCYISFDKYAHHAVITNYWDGRINVVELSPAGVPLRVVQEHQQTRRTTWRQVESREDHMANRQDGPHAHCNVFHPSYNWVFVPDLGDNVIHQYGYKEGRLTHQGHVALPPGEGPRHFVFHPTLPVAYSGCELLSRVQVFAVDSSDPDAVRARIRPVQSHTTLPEDFTTTNYVGEIKVDATGRFVYVSNRGHNSIAVYSIDQTTGFLTPVAIQKTGGKCPRHFGLSPCGHYAVVGDQDSNVVRVFKICPRNGTMEQLEGGEYPMGSPCFVMFHKPVLPMESHHALHPVVRITANATAHAMAAAMAPDSPPSSMPEHHEELELMSPTTMVACS